MNPFEKGFLEGIIPPPPMTVSEWSDKHRRLSSKGSSEPGPWRTDRTPYLKEPMNCLSVTNTDVERVVMMFGAQTGKTEAGINFLLYTIDHCPAPVLCVAASLDMVKRMSRQRLEPAFEETPVIKAKIAPQRSRDASNSMFIKEYPNGILMLTGSNSPAGLRSAPVRYLFLDEIDSYPADASTSGGVSEGDPCELAIKRTSTFSRKKILMTSTPTTKDFSRVENEYLASDMRKYWVKAPCCGKYQTLVWSQMKWENRDASTAQYECSHCGERFDESHKTSMLRQGEWRAEKPMTRKTAGFQMSSLYSPAGWLSWPEIVEEFLRSKDDAPLFKTWVNTRMAETFDESYQSQLSAEEMLEKCEKYLPGTIPEDVVCLVQGVDVQGGGGTKDERIEVSTWGIAPEEHMYLIQHDVIYGDPNQGTVWDGVDILLTSEWEHPNGGRLKVECCAIDTGGLATNSVYNYCRARKGSGVIGIKGSSQSGQPAIGRGSRVDLNYKGRPIKGGVVVYSVGTDTIKDVLYSRLKFNNKLHFHAQTTEEYFKQFTGEKKVLKKSGRGTQYVQKKNQNVEALDCAVYAYSALNHLYQRYPRSKFFQIFTNKLLNPTNSSGKKTLNLRNSATPTKGYVNQW
jgi:phage terminase large subunit GpA-like protein